MNDKNNNVEKIRTSPCPKCYLCGSEGKLLYKGLQDFLFGTPGFWDFKKCYNSECGLVWLDPMPIEADIGIACENYYTHKEIDFDSISLIHRCREQVREGYIANRFGYSKDISLYTRILGFLAYCSKTQREWMKSTVMHLKAKPGGRLLEVGCGNGSALAAMQNLGWEVEGLDFDPKAVESARFQYGLQVKSGSLIQQKYPSNSFDAVTMKHVIEHIYEPLELLKECHRILKPGGNLVIETPNMESLSSRYFNEFWRGLEPPRHLHLFTLASLKSLAISAGFKIEFLRTSSLGAASIYIEGINLRSSKKSSILGIVKSQRVRAHVYSLIESLFGYLDSKAGTTTIAVLRS